MHLSMRRLAIAGLIAQASASPQSLLQAAAPQYVNQPERAAAVKEAFQRSWDGYRKFAFPNDTLKPVSNTAENDRYVSVFCSKRDRAQRPPFTDNVML